MLKTLHNESDAVQIVHNVHNADTKGAFEQFEHYEHEHKQIAPFVADDVDGDFDERAAIIEHDAGIPRAWAEAFARVSLMQCPKNVTRRGWQRIVDNTGRLLDDKNHLRDMVRYGWTVEDIFGCHPMAPEVRQDVKGLLLLLGDSEVISVVNANVIGLKCSSGSMLFYRRPINPSPERVMIWGLNP